MVDVEIIGGQEMVNILRNFPIRIRKNLMAKATRAGAKVILEEAKRLVPVDTGSLRNSLDVVKRRSKDKNLIWYSILPRASKKKTKRFKLADGKIYKITGEVGAGWYAHMVEFGTSHSSPHPFMRPAESKSDEAFTKMKETLKKGVDREFEKAKK